MPQFMPMALGQIDPSVIDDTSKHSMGMSQDDSNQPASVQSEEEDKSESEGESSSDEESSEQKNAAPKPKDKKEATEIFKELLKEKVNLSRKNVLIMDD